MDAQTIARVEPTRVAVLGTLAEFHQEPIPYNMAALVKLVARINPDILCLDVSPQIWQEKDFSALSPEYREGLLPLASWSDMVVVPIGANHSPRSVHILGWRGRLIEWLRGWLADIQRGAPGPDAINRGPRHEVANVLYHIVLLLSGPKAFDQRQNHTETLLRRILEVARNNPGARILVVVNVQFCHVIRPRLQEHPEIRVISYTDL